MPAFSVILTSATRSSKCPFPSGFPTKTSCVPHSPPISFSFSDHPSDVCQGRQVRSSTLCAFLWPCVTSRLLYSEKTFQETEKLRTFVSTGRVKWIGTSNIARGTKRTALIRDFTLRPHSGLLKEVVQIQVASKLPLRHGTTSSVWMKFSTALSTSDVWEYVTGVFFGCTGVCKKQ